MFTGIITHIGIVKERSSTGIEIKMPDDLSKKVNTSGSICVNGVCLTITKIEKNIFSADIMPETWSKTSLGSLKREDQVNLELPLSASGRFEGHIVQGHVDGVGTIRTIEQRGNSKHIIVGIDPTLAHQCVQKGSIAIQGISLTLINVGDDYIEVGIIPYTWTHTMLHTAQVGMPLNIEIDIIAKYAHRLHSLYKGG